jgi:serine/threonine-protein phosphatase PGAM5
VCLLGDHVPPVPDLATLPEVFVNFRADVPPAVLASGAVAARAATDRHAVPPDTDPATHEVIVTHSFMVGWFVRHALGAPDERWLTLNL